VEGVLIQVALNGGRSKTEHPRVPITAAETARESAAAVRAGAGGIHVHVRARSTEESLAPGDVAEVVAAIRASCPGVPLGVSTGAWIVPDPHERLALVRAWAVLPDFASVNVHEAGAVELIELLVGRGVGVEVGVTSPIAAEALMSTGLAGRCLRVLLEPSEDDVPKARETVEAIDSVLDREACGLPRLLHGQETTAWEMIREAARRGYDTRVGLEDTIALPDGRLAADGAALIHVARRIMMEPGA
jgi:uncharacterized protein (DUF849 family)